MFNTGITNHFTTFCSLSNLKNIRNFVDSSLTKASVNTVDKEMIILAVDEVCSNSIIHSNRENPNSIIDIYLKTLENQVVVEIKDSGAKFNYEAYQLPTVDGLIKSKSKGKMGLMIVKNVIDKIEYEHKSHSNVFRLTKKI